MSLFSENTPDYKEPNHNLFIRSKDIPYDVITHVKSSQVTFIYIALLTIQIVTKQLHNIKMGK